MDQEEKPNKYLEELEKEMTTLKKTAQSQGLDEDDVTKCVKAALSRPLSDTPRAPMNRCKKCLLVMTVAIAVVLSLPFLTSWALETTPGFFVSDYFMKYYSTPVMQFLRRHTLFLHNYNISQLYVSECMVKNPFFEAPSPGCYTCERVHAIKTVPEGYRVRRNHLAFPLIFKKRMERPVTVEDLAEMAEDAKERLAWDSTHFYSSNMPWISSSLDLLQPEVLDNIYNTSYFHFSWSVNTLFGSQLFRKKFPRHPSLPPELEISLEKQIFIDGWDTPPHAPTYSPGGGTVLYIQGSGMRKLVLTPPKDCSDVCIPVSILVNQSDFVTWPSQTYSATFFLAGSKVSVSMMGYLQ